jgi:broad specificity phosphatase PhoE
MKNTDGTRTRNMMIYLMRHAQTIDNLVKRYTGNNDSIGISKEGKKQLKDIIPFLKSKKIQLIFSSPFERCFQTAWEIKKILEVDLVTDERLREVNYGKWQGLTSDEVKERFPEIFKARREDPVNIAPPEGETLLSMQERVIRTLEGIISQNKSSLVITHGSCIHASLMYYKKINLMKFWVFSQKYKLNNCSISTIVVSGNKIRVNKIGYCPRKF